MNKYSKEQLAEISKEVFANNKGDKFYATDDGTFFPNEGDALKHAAEFQCEIHVFNREQDEPEVFVTKERCEDFVRSLFDKISEGTGYSFEDLELMMQGRYVKPETVETKTEETTSTEEKKEEVQTSEVKTETESKEETPKTEEKGTTKPVETKTTKTTAKK